MHRETLIGIALIVTWIVLAGVVQWASGLAHIPLAAGTVFLARGIVLQSMDKRPD